MARVGMVLFSSLAPSLGVGLAIFRLGGEWDGVECRWTDMLGCFVNAIIFVAAWYSLVLHPIVI